MISDRARDALKWVAHATGEVHHWGDVRTEGVLRARALGAPWQAIGDALGVSKQAAQRKYAADERMGKVVSDE